MISFFRDAKANPLLALMDPRMCPEDVDLTLLEQSLKAVVREWKIDGLPSLWVDEGM